MTDKIELLDPDEYATDYNKGELEKLQAKINDLTRKLNQIIQVINQEK